MIENNRVFPEARTQVILGVERLLTQKMLPCGKRRHGAIWGTHGEDRIRVCAVFIKDIRERMMKT